MENSIGTTIFHGTTFSQEELNSIEAALKKISLDKGSILLGEGEIVLNQYFVTSGCLRTYFIDNSGKEHTLQFAIKDWWISDYTAFFSGTKSIMSIECIQDAIVYKLPKKRMEQLYIDIPKFETFFRIKLEKAFAAFQKRTLGNLALTAKERYLYFISAYPNIEQNVKNYHIASYLGITTESLSRIRKTL
jgi:CRP-like cAMP-binding protein